MVLKSIWFNLTTANKITLHNIEEMMTNEGFDVKFIDGLLYSFKKRIEVHGEDQFRKWICELNYTLPEEFHNKETCLSVYERSSEWIEEEIRRLEAETRLSWTEQAADLEIEDERACKVQLVIRHRLTEVISDILDQ
ncbi:hypothetical protein QTG56_25370 (plasmid) [Rossellomorea sp. AcN35-11]|nr:hypothetical protein [Rossellomorea aquimaris]WJV31947.1 hypothetical protein QTG56_25370 [Rossellomorea sp. AcN35-11]